MGDVMAYYWRKNMTEYLLKEYLSTNSYYKMNVIDKDIDNPYASILRPLSRLVSDQRIADDVNSLTSDGALGVAGFITKLGTSAFLIYGFVHHVCRTHYSIFTIDRWSGGAL